MKPGDVGDGNENRMESLVPRLPSTKTSRDYL